jgi:uncharacterized coiled-coil DUF342 family protein
MDWVYLIIPLGAAGFILYSLILYINAASNLKPKIDASKKTIRECEDGIETEEKETLNAKRAVDTLHRAIGDLEKELKESDAKIAELRAQEVQVKEKEEHQHPTRVNREEGQ